MILSGIALFFFVYTYAKIITNNLHIVKLRKPFIPTVCGKIKKVFRQLRKIGICDIIVNNTVFGRIVYINIK